MKRAIFVPMALAIIGLSALAQGPDERGSVLRTPGFDAPPLAPVVPKSPAAQPPAKGASMQSPDLMRIFAPGAVPAEPADPNARRGLALEEVPDINKDLNVTPAAGPWMIMVISYPGKDGPTQARKMCLEIRQTNRVPAFTFMYGAEERRKELERVKKIMDDQQQFFKQHNIAPTEPLRLRHQQIDVHSAVLIGGYATDEAAKAALARVREWKQPDEKKVDLEVKHYRGVDSKGEKVEAFYVNPFKRAFVVRNPTTKITPVGEAKLDVATLKRMNADEPYSLFNCKKPFTLAVKEFQTQHRMLDRDTSASLWDKLVPLQKSAPRDSAADNAHNLVDLLRTKMKYEAFVLHSKFSSTVTVGGFDGPDDPALRAMQDRLAAMFSSPGAAMLQCFHRPVPMEVPR
jgi:hypothetical protein